MYRRIVSWFFRIPTRTSPFTSVCHLALWLFLSAGMIELTITQPSCIFGFSSQTCFGKDITGFDSLVINDGPRFLYGIMVIWLVSSIIREITYLHYRWEEWKSLRAERIESEIQAEVERRMAESEKARRND